jgi:hypothetical protein
MWNVLLSGLSVFGVSVHRVERDDAVEHDAIVAHEECRGA